MYLVIFVILFLGSYIRPKKHYIKLNKKYDIANMYLTTVCVALMLISAFRYNTGRDFHTYTSTLLYLKTGKSLSWLNYEPGFMLLYKILAPFTKSGQIIIVVSSAITITLFCISIKEHSVNVCQSLFLFYALYMYCMSFNLIRQFIAIGIINVSMWYFRERKLPKAMLCILVAAMFHSTALLCVPFYFFQTIKMKFRVIVIIVLVSLVLFGFYDQIVSFILSFIPKYARYLNAEGSSSVFNIAVLLVTLVMLLYIREGHLYQPDEIKTLNFFISAALFCLIITVFTVKIVYFARASYYFFTISVYSIPYCWKKLKGRKEYFFARIVTMVITAMLFIHLLRANSGSVVPYQFWDFKSL